MHRLLTRCRSYYATLAHECTHWTRYESRVNRHFERKRFGDEGYAMQIDDTEGFLSTLQEFLTRPGNRLKGGGSNLDNQEIGKDVSTTR